MKNNNCIFGNEETYKASSSVWHFYKSNNIRNGIRLMLSNIDRSYPFYFHGVEWKDSESLFMCGEFSDNSEEHKYVQTALNSNINGLAKKRFIRLKYKELARNDFNEFQLQWMFYVIWNKCKGNANFRNILTDIPKEVTIIADTTKSNDYMAYFWGCKNIELTKHIETLEKRIISQNNHLRKVDLRLKIRNETNKINNIGEWNGQNNYGKILMKCRDCLLNNTAPDIDYDLLRSKNIYIFNKPIEI